MGMGWRRLPPRRRRSTEVVGRFQELLPSLRDSTHFLRPTQDSTRGSLWADSGAAPTGWIFGYARHSRSTGSSSVESRGVIEIAEQKGFVSQTNAPLGLYSLPKNPRSCEERIERTFSFASKLCCRLSGAASAGDRLFIPSFSANCVACDRISDEKHRQFLSHSLPDSYL